AGRPERAEQMARKILEQDEGNAAALAVIRDIRNAAAAAKVDGLLQNGKFRDARAEVERLREDLIDGGQALQTAIETGHTAFEQMTAKHASTSLAQKHFAVAMSNVKEAQAELRDGGEGLRSRVRGKWLESIDDAFQRNQREEALVMRREFLGSFPDDTD